MLYRKVMHLGRHCQMDRSFGDAMTNYYVVKFCRTCWKIKPLWFAKYILEGMYHATKVQLWQWFYQFRECNIPKLKRSWGGWVYKSQYWDTETRVGVHASRDWRENKNKFDTVVFIQVPLCFLQIIFAITSCIWPLLIGHGVVLWYHCRALYDVVRDSWR